MKKTIPELFGMFIGSFSGEPVEESRKPKTENEGAQNLADNFDSYVESFKAQGGIVIPEGEQES